VVLTQELAQQVWANLLLIMIANPALVVHPRQPMAIRQVPVIPVVPLLETATLLVLVVTVVDQMELVDRLPMLEVVQTVVVIMITMVVMDEEDNCVAIGLPAPLI